MHVPTVGAVTRLWTSTSANAAWDPGWSRILSFVRTTVAHLGAPSTRAWWTTTCATAPAPARTRQTTLVKTVLAFLFAVSLLVGLAALRTEYFNVLPCLHWMWAALSLIFLSTTRFATVHGLALMKPRNKCFFLMASSRYIR